MKVAQSPTPWTVGCHAPLSMGFSRQEYWSGLPFPLPRDLSNPGFKPGYPALQTLRTEPPGKLRLKGAVPLRRLVPRTNGEGCTRRDQADGAGQLVE